jgi:cell division protein FtsL
MPNLMSDRTFVALLILLAVVCAIGVIYITSAH